MKNISPIDPTKELLRWGPVPGKFFYMSEFNDACFTRFAARFPGKGVPDALLVFHEGRFLYVQELAPFRAACKTMFTEIVMNDATRSLLFTEWKNAVAEQLIVQKIIDGTNLSSLSDKDFRKLWDDFYEKAIQFWLPTIAAEFGNYGSDQLLEEALALHIADKNDIASAMEILTAPEALSFYQEEEIELSESADIETHQQKYYWLKNSYAGSQILPVQFFINRKRELAENIRKHQEQRLFDVKTNKQELIALYNIPSDVVKIADVLRMAIEWQDERKKYIFQTLHYKDILLKHTAERFGYDFQTLLNYDFHEIEEFVFHRTCKETYTERNTGGSASIVLTSPTTYDIDISTLATEHVADAWKQYLNEDIKSGTREFKGSIACIGDGKPVRGVVRVLLDPNQSNEFKPGEILVAPMTSPEYVFVMKIASAILTDTGGLTSHAAIVSRELNVPCLVGTKIATHLLKDGDIVEVDAQKGTVKILS